MEVLSELITNMLHSSARSYIGVGFIACYFIWVVSMAMMRIKKGEHLDHH